jgi:hypothetical protein
MLFIYNNICITNIFCYVDEKVIENFRYLCWIIYNIKENKLITDDLNFKPVSSDFVSKQINKLNVKKATDYDGISPKILKLSKPCIVEPINFFY